MDYKFINSIAIILLGISFIIKTITFVRAYKRLEKRIRLVEKALKENQQMNRKN